MRHVVRTWEPGGIDHIWCGVTLNILLEGIGGSMEESWHDDFTHECTPAASTWVRVVMIYNFCCVEGVGKVLLCYQRCDGWSFFSVGRSLSGTCICWYSRVQVSGLEDKVSEVPGVTMVAFTSGPCCMLRLKETGAELKRTSSEGIYVGAIHGWVYVFLLSFILAHDWKGSDWGWGPYLNSSVDEKFRFPGSSSFPWICPSDTRVYFTLNAKCHCYGILSLHFLFFHLTWNKKKHLCDFFSHKQHTHCIK